MCPENDFLNSKYKKMATSDILKPAVLDPRVVQNQAAYAVNRGAMSLTSQPFAALGASTEQQSFQVIVPSQSVFVGRDMDWSSDVFMKFNCDTTDVSGAAVVVLGKDAALAAFPLHQAVNTLTATINDCVVSINLSDVLNEVLRLCDYKRNRLIRHCPTMLDKYADNNDGYLSINTPLNSYIDAVSSDEQPNGAWGQLYFTDANGAILTGSANYPNVYNGSGVVSYVDGIPVKTGGVTKYSIYIKWSSSEKLVLSPFQFAEADPACGLFGCNQIQLVMTMKSNPSRVLRTTSAGGCVISGITYNTQPSNGAFQNASIQAQFFTPNIEMNLPAKSQIPYMEFPRYLKPGAGAPASIETLSSNTITLPQIPDSLIVYAKPQTYGATEAEWYYPIRKISLQFDNFSGLMSNFSKYQLFQESVHSGLEMSWDEWSGFAKGADGKNIQTVGGPVIIRPSISFGLQAGLAPGSLGQFSLQMDVTIDNFFPRPGPIFSSPANLYIITVNSGFLETMSGQSRLLKALLSEADVISAEPIGTSMTLGRMAGRGFFDKLGPMLTKTMEFYQKTKPLVSGVKNLLPEGKARDVLTKIGYGAAGSGMAGAAMPAGAGKKSLSQRLM